MFEVFPRNEGSAYQKVCTTHESCSHIRACSKEDWSVWSQCLSPTGSLQ